MKRISFYFFNVSNQSFFLVDNLHVTLYACSQSTNLRKYFYFCRNYYSGIENYWSGFFSSSCRETRTWNASRSASADFRPARITLVFLVIFSESFISWSLFFFSSVSTWQRANHGQNNEVFEYSLFSFVQSDIIMFISWWLLSIYNGVTCSWINSRQLQICFRNRPTR